MGVTFQITVDSSGAERRLASIQRAFDRETFLKITGQRLLAWINQNFREGGAEQKWAPLSPNTIAGRRGGGAGAQPLRDIGRLAQSFVSRVSTDEVWVGTEDQKAEWHHFGTRPRTITTNPADRASRKNPKRPGALIFMTPKGPVFRRSVHHPGIPARPLLPSQALAEHLAKGVLDAYVDQVAKQT